ncbi:MAG: HDIG domain-containing protein [Candidatus Nanohaloarchaea archaeon]|nr:HDIG domain-containing protein [Candidatus Nanohaloarchaea archaeon]
MDEEIRDAAEQQYSDELPYHNFQHIQHALEFAETLLERCARYGIPVDSDIVRYAVLFHDAGYHEDHKAEGYDTKEQYSAAIAADELERHGRDQETIDEVRQCILATEEGASFDTPEEKIVRAADLAQIGGSYTVLEENAERLRDEVEQLHDTELSDEEWIEQVRDTIGHYLEQDIRLTPEHDHRGVSKFHARARRNLERFIEEHTD